MFHLQTRIIAHLDYGRDGGRLGVNPSISDGRKGIRRQGGTTAGLVENEPPWDAIQGVVGKVVIAGESDGLVEIVRLPLVGRITPRRLHKVPEHWVQRRILLVQVKFQLWAGRGGGTREERSEELCQLFSANAVQRKIH